jgi:hypothetical protein
LKVIKKIVVATLLVLPAFLLFDCANPVSPTGGAKDEEPPLVLSSTPPNNVVFFDKSRISINFNEYVKLKNPNQQILISPPFAKNPEYKLRGKTLVIDLDEELLPNTTYTIFFGNAIVDLTEENPLVNYLYSFSTGSYIDSLAIGGEVVDAFNLQPRENIFVMLFPVSIDTVPQDSIPMLTRPLYVSKTDVNGQFQLRNLRNEQYRLFALEDVNSNYLFDQPNESIAFLDSLISPEIFEIPATDTVMQSDSTNTPADSTHTDSLHIRHVYDNYYRLLMFQQTDTVQRFLGAEAFYPPKFRLTFEFPTQDLKYTVINQDPGEDWKIEQFSINRDSLTVWVKNLELDSLQLTVADQDSIFDTVMVVFSKAKEKTELKKGRRKKDEETVERMQIKTNARGRTLDLGKPFKLIMENPLISWDFTTTTFIAGEDTMTGAPFKKADSIATLFELDYELTEATYYEFIFPDSIFKTIYGLTNDSLQAAFTTAETSSYGNLILNIEMGETPYLIQLMDAKENTLESIYLTTSRTLKFDFLTAGTYLIKAVEDKWRNKRWDTGIYVEKRQPENVYYYPAEIQVRANWEIEETWSLP